MWNWFSFQRQCLPSDRLLQGVWGTENGAPAMSFGGLCYDYVMVSLQRLLLISLRTGITVTFSLKALGWCKFVRGFSRAYKRGSLYPHGWGGETYNRTKKAFQNKLHGSAGLNTFWIYSFQYKLEVGGGLISEGFTVVDPGEGSGPTPLKNVQSGTQAPWSWPASGPLQNWRNCVSQNMVAIGTSSRHVGRTTRKCCAIKKWSHIPCLRRHFFPARFPICFLFGFLEFQTDRFDLKKPDH